MNGLALCAGVEGIGLGLSIADPGYRTVCIVEREAYAAALLATRMEQQAIPPCPIWDDLETFDGKRWRGIVDIVHAGLPCQPYSVAGKRKGDADERYLWPAFFRILDDVRAPMVFIENVPGLLAWFRPIGEELCRLGYEITCGIFSAAEVGASHRRERLFILAYRRGERRQESGSPHGHEESDAGWTASDDHIPASEGSGLANSDGKSRRRSEQSLPPSEPESGPATDDGIGDLADSSHGQFSQPGRRTQGRDGAGSAGEDVDNATSPRHEVRRSEPSGPLRNQTRRRQSGGRRDTLANASQPGLQRLGGNVDDGDQSGRVDSSAPRSTPTSGIPVFPPGPSDHERWRHIIEQWPELAPAVADGNLKRRGHLEIGASIDTERSTSGDDTDGCDSTEGIEEETESELHRLADGIPTGLDFRVDRLRAGGNAVVPLQAAYAFITLARKAGLI